MENIYSPEAKDENVSIKYHLKSEGTKEVNEIRDIPTAGAIWQKFLEALSEAVPHSAIKTWFSVISPKIYENRVLTVEVPSEDFYKLITRKYSKQIVKILESSAFDEKIEIKYEVAQLDLFMDDAKRNHDVPVKDTSNPEKKSFSPPPVITPAVEFNTNIMPRYTFDNLVKGEHNELAVAIATAISNNPGKTYNPFFIYGGVGLGKTHLLYAIGNEIMNKFPGKKVYYTTTPDFTTQFTSHIAKGKIDYANQKFDSKYLDNFYKSLDVLLLDDVQNLSGKEKTQDFIYQIFNTLFNQKKHIIFTSDKPINQVQGIEERLLSRFQWGITADIQKPNWETRVAIIKKKFNEAGEDVPEEIIHHIASNVTENIRAIEGCVIGIITQSTLTGNGEITFDVAEAVLRRVVGEVRRSKTISIENIINVSAEYYNVPEKLIRSRKRTKEIAYARQIAMYLAKELTSSTLESIGLNFGGKDHATVLYAHKSITELVSKDPDVKNQINDIKDRIKNQ